MKVATVCNFYRKPMKLTKGQETRIRIIKISTELFLKKGLYNITFSQIAKAAKITQPAIYRHFKDMDDLFLESCKYWVTESVIYINQNADNLESAELQIRQYLERHLIYTVKNRSHDALLFGLYYYSMRSQKMLDFYLDLKNRSLLRLKRILNFGNIDRSWAVQDVDALAETIHSLLVGEVIKILIEPDQQAAQIAFERMINLFKKLTV